MSYRIEPSTAPALSERERELLGQAADLLIPRGTGTGVDGVDMPSGSEGHVAGSGIDRVFSVRPDLAGPVRTALAELQRRGVPSDFAALAAEPPEGFAALADAITAAYFLDAEVARRVGYEKRSEIPIVFDADLDAVTATVRGRGPIFRPTPATAPLPIGTPPEAEAAGAAATEPTDTSTEATA